MKKRFPLFAALSLGLFLFSFAYGQEKQKIAFIFVGEEPKKGTFKPLFSQMQMATMKKYTSEDRTMEFRKLIEAGNETQINRTVSLWGVKYIIFIEMPEAIDGYHLEAKMIDVGTSEIVKMSIAESKLESSKDLSTATQVIVAGLFDISENSSSSKASNSNRATFTDNRDNQRYEIVQIGSLAWMAKNLNYNKGKSWCYDDAKFNCDKYGRLYDWHTAMEVCPSGWKLPSRSEWNDLVQTVGKDFAGKKLKSNEGQGTDDFGFFALLGGRRNTGGSFNYLKEDGRWWTSTTTSEGSNAYYQFMSSRMDNVDENLRANDFANGYSVRCVIGPPDTNIAKSNVVSSSNKKPDNIFTDTRDNQEYKFIEIGRLVWMAKNLNYNDNKNKSYCYGNEDFNCKKYGRLYDWNTAKKVCPSGWHLPTRGEWHDLIRYVDEKVEREKSKTTLFSDIGKELFGMTGNLIGKTLDVVADASATDQTVTSGVAGNVVSGKKLKSKEANGTDNYGFSALLGGSIGPNKNGDKVFHDIDKEAGWWTATETKEAPNKVYEIIINSESDYVIEATFGKSSGYDSVRCVRD